MNSSADWRVRGILAAFSFVAAAAGLPPAAADGGQKTAAKPAERLAEARTHYLRGRIDEAAEIFEELAGPEPAPSETIDAVRIAAVLGAARCQTARGEYDAAEKRLAAAVRAAESAPLRAALAELQFARGRYADALATARSALQLDPDEPRAHLVEADALAERGQLKEADEAYRWFVRYYNRVQPKDPETLVIVGRGAAQYARWNRVTQVFRFLVNTVAPDALAADKQYWPAHQLAGELLLEKYNKAQALPELRRALAIDPNAADVLVALGSAALQEFELDAARDFAERALRQNPAHAGALRLLADLLLADGDLASASAALQRAMQVNPHDQRTLALSAAVLLLSQGPPPADDLAALLERIESIDGYRPQSPGPFAALVVELARRNPRPGVFFEQLAARMERHKKFALAEQFYRTATRVMPQHADAVTGLGLLSMRIGRIDDARKILDEAVQADPYHVRVSNMRKVLRLIDEYETIKTDHFMIRVDGREDRILGKMMAEFLEEQYPLLTEEYGFEPPQRTQFEVFHRAKGLSGHEWFSARMVGLPWVQTIGASTGMIVALTSPNDGDRPFHWARVVRHEFVHILTLQQTDFNIPHWYTEALAVSSEQAPRPVLWDRLLAQRVPADPSWITAAAESGALPAGLFSLDTINHGFVRPPSPNDWQMAYCQSFLYSEYMKERFGSDACKKLLNAYREQPTTSTALRTAFDVDQADFEAGYRRFLQKFTDSVRTEQFVPVLSAAELEKRVRAQPQVASYAAEFAYVLLQQKQMEQAARQARAALELDPKEPLAAVVLARLALLEKDEDKAVSILQTGLDVKRPHPRLIQDLAELLIKADEAEAAAGLCDLGLKRAPRDAGLVQALIAACLKTGNKDRLKSALELRMTLDGDDPSVPQLLAQLELDAGNAEAAVRYAKESLYIDVLDPQSHRLLGLAYAAARQPDRAIDEFQTAVELEPRDASLRLNLARLQLAAGMKTRARETLQGLLQLESDHEEAKRLLESLDR